MTKPSSPRNILVLLACFLSPLFVVVEAADPNFDFGGEKFCKPFGCGKGKEPIQKWPLKFQSSGCSSIGGAMAMTMGDKNSVHESCCDQRAACLQTCGAVKTTCDEVFQQCVKDVCAASVNEGECHQGASLFSVMMKMEGCREYDAQQYSHCECVASEEAINRRENILRKFYKKFSPESVDKVEGLAKKADTPRKMANLMGKLVKKYYPKTIQKIKDPKQEMMEKMMKEKAEETTTDEVGDEGTEEEDVQEL